jgi:hypothetical protein
VSTAWKVTPIRFPIELLQEMEVMVNQINATGPVTPVTLSELVRISVRKWLRERERQQRYQEKKKTRAKRLQPGPDSGA